jgi:hypothetical protein
MTTPELEPVPYKIPLLDEPGGLTQRWATWFKNIRERVNDWAASHAASGYQKQPSGLYIQWGVTASLGSGTTTGITFPTAFPTGCLQVVAGVKDNSAVATTTTGQWGTGNYATTGFDLYNRTSGALTFNYIAVGY